MAPTRMKLRVRRRDNTAATAAGGGLLEEEEGRSRETRRKNTRKTSATAAAAVGASSSSPPTSSSSASARAVMAAAEEASPDSKCPICLDRFNNLAYLDRCLHRFCFPCIQEWSHNKAECPLCKQPFASILHSVRAEDDFKEYTLRPAPANSSVAATVAMVAAMASAARTNHQMRLMLRRHRVADGGETTTRRRRRERGGRGSGGRRAEERPGVWEWYLDSPPLPVPALPHHPAVSPMVTEDSDEGEEQRARAGVELAERGVIFEGLTGLEGAVAPVAPNDRVSRRLMTRLAARQRLQREGGTVRRLRERETVALRRALYRCGIRVRGIAGVTGNQGPQRDISAESFRRSPALLKKLRPWLRRELTVLYGAHGSLVEIVQRIIMACLARHGLEDTPTVEEDLRPFLLARTEHFLHELVSFARSPLSLDSYDLQAMYDLPTAVMELDWISSSSDSSSVIAISEDDEEEEEEEEAREVVGRSEEMGPTTVTRGPHDDVIQAGSSLSLSAWDDETPGPSYSTADASCSLTSLPFSPAPQEAANQEGAEKQEEEECLIVGYKKPIAERTPELVQLSSDTEEEEKKKKDEDPPSLPSTDPPLSFLPTIPPSTSGAYREEQDDQPKEQDGEATGRCSRARSWSESSGRSRNSVCTLSPAIPGEGDRRRRRERVSWRDRRRSREKRRKKRRRRGREGKSGTLYNPNHSIYPAMLRRRSRSSSPFRSSTESDSPPSPADSSWGSHSSQVSALTSSASSPSQSSSSPLCFSPLPLSPPPQTPPSRSPTGNPHHGEKPGGKRKYKSRHLDSDLKDPTWRPSGSQRKEKRKERRKRGRDGGRRRESCGGESSSRRSREDRSPSVEIIYEGTITCDSTKPPARKRHRKRHRRAQQQSSSPVIITLDSDSSNNGVGDKTISGSSSPLSSQQTIDFSDLPALPLVQSAGVGGALEAELSELPIDILDGSDTELASRLRAARSISSDDSERDVVDVENVQESVSLLGRDNKAPSSNTLGPIRAVDTKASSGDKQGESGGAGGGSRSAGEDFSTFAKRNESRRRDSEELNSDRNLLATILNDLREISAPKGDLSLSFEASCSPESRARRYRDPCEVNQARRNQASWLSKHPPDLPKVRDQNSGFDFTSGCAAVPSPPPLEWQKERQLRQEDGGDAPPLLKQASPVRLHNRNTPPPLKHKDAASPHRPLVSPADLHSHHAPVHADPLTPPVVFGGNPAAPPVDSCLAVEQTIPPISTIKRHYRSTLAVTTSHKPPIDSHSSARSKQSADCLTRLDSLHSSNERTVEVASGPVDLYPVNPSCSIALHSAETSWSKKAPAHSDYTSRGCRNKTASPNSCRAPPVDLHPSSSAAEVAPAGCRVFSGVNSNDISAPVFVSPIDSRTLNPSSPIDSLSSNKKARCPSSVNSSVPTAAPSDRLSPTDLHPGSSKPSVDLHRSLNHEDGSRRAHLPPIDLYCTTLLPPDSLDPPPFVGAVNARHLNHTALSSSPSEHTIDFHTSHRRCGSQPEATVGPRSKTLNHFEPDSSTEFPQKLNVPHLNSDPKPLIDTHSKCHRRDFQVHADSRRVAENQCNSNATADARSDEPSDIWNSHSTTKQNVRRT